MSEEKVILTSKEAIIGLADEFPIEQIYVKEWKSSIYLRPINVEERVKWENSIKPEDPALSALTLLIYSICDEKGNLLFSESDIPMLRKKRSSAILRLFKVAQRISKMREKDIEEEIKNSDAPQRD